MSNTFSLNRIKLLLRADWIEHRIKLIYHIGATIAGVLCYFLLVYANYDGNLIRIQNIAFVFGTVGTLINYCKYISNKIHQPKGLFLTLPANTIEKYVVLLLEGILLVFIFALIFWAGLPVISLFIANIPPIWPWGMWTFGNLSLYCFFFSLFFLSYITFRKHAVTITIVCIAATIASFIGLIFLVRYLVITYLGTDYNLPESIQKIAESILYFVKDYHGYLLSALNLFIFYRAYLKLKRKELR